MGLALRGTARRSVRRFVTGGLAVVLAGGLVACSAVKRNVKETVVIAKAMKGYTYHTSLDTVLRAARIEFTDEWHDVQWQITNVSDSSFTTNWIEADLDVRVRRRYEVRGTRTIDGCQLSIEKVKEWYDPQRGEWGRRERSRAVRTELEVVMRVEPERGRAIQAKVDSVGVGA